MFDFPTPPHDQQASLSPGILAVLMRILGSQQAHPGQFGNQIADGPVGENSQLGWGTAPPMQYPQHQAPPPANFASAAHARPPASHTYRPQHVQYFDSPPLVQGTQNVAIQGPYGASSKLGSQGGGSSAGSGYAPHLTPAQIATIHRLWHRSRGGGRPI